MDSPDKYPPNMTAKELGAIYMSDYLTHTLAGDDAYKTGNNAYARQQWLDAIDKLDLAYKTWNVEPPNTVAFFNALNKVGVGQW